jgi:hypothetical protein
MSMSNQDQRYWFRAKRYGWGWGLPLTWQGWTVLAVWSAVVIVGFRYLLPPRVAPDLIFVLVMILLLLGICYLKGEPPRWRWGDQDN